MNSTVEIYVDGCCINNPGPGGIGVVILCNGKRKELLQGYKLTTNNRLEIRAAILALQSLKTPCSVTIFSDSKLLCDAFNQNWLVSWRRNDWRGSLGKSVKNVDLWKMLLLETEKHLVTFVWIRGHNGNRENEICDKIAKEAATLDESMLQVDYGYLNPIPEAPLPSSQGKQLRLFG